MKSKYFVPLVLTLIILLGGFLRIYKVTENPPSLTGDEISFGYAAYSMLETGRDEHGKFLPLVFESIGDFKNPLPAYLMLVSFTVFGPTDFGIRFQNVFFGTLFIFVFYFFLKYLFKDKNLALVGAFLMSISAWMILYSRFAYEPLIGSFFVLLGVWSFMRFLDGRLYWGIISALFLILTMYTAFAPRLFIPVFVIMALLFYYGFKHGKRDWKKILVFLGSCVVLGLPLLYVSLFAGAGTRLSMVLLSNDIDFTRYVNLSGVHSIADLPWLFFFWVKRYLTYLDPSFVLFNGLNMTLPWAFGLGLIYLFELPFLVLGVIEFIKRKVPYKAILVIWLLTGIIPDSITNNQQHSGRLLHIAPVLLIFTTLGAIRFFNWIRDLSKPYLKYTVLGVFSFAVVLNLIHAFLVFSIHFPRHRGESFDQGIREAVSFIKDNGDKYSKIVFDPRRGVDGPYLVSNPQMYVLFYTRYDPRTYQTETKKLSSDKDNPFLGFGKYEFRHINWTDDRFNKGTLFIGSPWNLPIKDLKPGELLETIYLSTGQAAYYIVSPN